MKRNLPFMLLAPLIVTAAQPATLALYGELYDVSSIIAWHPGGPAILRQARSLALTDATPMFESQHAFRDADEMRAKLAPYRVNGTAPQLYAFNDKGFYRTLRRRAAAFVREHELAEVDTHPALKTAAPKGGVYVVLKYALFMVIALWLSFKSVRVPPGAAGLARSALLALFAGAFTVAATFCLLHDASHMAVFTRDAATTDVIGRFTQTAVWWDAAIWRAHHVLLHHAYTGDVTRDPDMRHGVATFCKAKEVYRCDPDTPTRQFVQSLSTLYIGQAIMYLDSKIKGYRVALGAHERTAPLGNGIDNIHGILFEGWSWWQYVLAAAPACYPLANFVSARRQGASVKLAATRAAAGSTLFLLGCNVVFAMNILIDHDAHANYELYDEFVLAVGSTSAADWGEVQVRATANWAGPI